MTENVRAIAQTAGVVVVDEDRAITILCLVLSVVFPIAGLPLSVWIRRRIRSHGGDTHLATLAVQISAFILTVLVIVMLVGFFLSVIVPLMS